MSSSPPPLVIFDWDDTLVLTTDRRRDLLVRTIRALGHVADESASLSAWGLPFEKLAEAIAPELPLGQLLPHYLAAMAANGPELTHGAAELLKALHECGTRTTVFTSSIRVLVELDAKLLSIDGLIDEIWSSDEARYFKPDPRSLAEFLAPPTSTLPVEDLCYVGDSLNDFLVASANGVEFIAVTTGAASEEEFRSAGLRSARIFRSLASVQDFWMA